MAKQFSDREKALIISIYKAKDSNTYALMSVFSQWLDPRGGIRFSLEDVDLVYDLNIFKESNDVLTIKKEIIRVALLIKYLEDEGYIYIIQDESSTDLPPYVGAQEIQRPLQVALPPEISYIISRSLYNIYVSYDLIYFVENGFRTDEDLQLIQASKNLDASNKQIRISRGSLVVSTLTLLCTLLMSQFSNCSQQKHNESMLNALTNFEANYCAINNQNTLELSAHIDSLGVTLNNIKQPANVVKKCNKTIKRQYNYLRIDTMSCDGVKYIILPINDQISK